MQKIFLQGRLVADAAVREYNGRTFLSFVLACNERVKNEEIPTYYNVVWNSYAEGMVQYLTKGKALTVVGNVRISTEVSPKDGKTYPRADVRAESVDFVQFGGSGNTNTVNEAKAAPVAQPQPVYTQPAQPQPVYPQQPTYAPQQPVQPAYPQQPTYAPQQPTCGGIPSPADDDLPF